MAETSIKQVFQGMVPNQIGICEGTVIAVNPIKVQISNSKMVASGTTLIVPVHLTDYERTADISLNGGSISSTTTTNDAHSHRLQSFSIVSGKIKIYEGLKVGETVYLLRFNNGEKYYVLDRKE